MQKLTIPYIKSLGKEKSNENLLLLIELYKDKSVSLELKREIVSSIGRQNDKEIVAEFIKNNYTSKLNSMDMVYQFYRTCLYNYHIETFKKIADDIEEFYQNEIILKMKEYFLYKNGNIKFKETSSNIDTPSLLCGDCESTLHQVKEKSVKLIFTSPPYYNAREYSTYKSYNEYLLKMKAVFKSCKQVLEDGRFIIINVSPVITKRPGREFASIRYPIHFDFHKLLEEVGFEFIDEIIWKKPDYSVPSRNGGYTQTRMPLSYKPNCVTESIMIYRKNAPFLLDKNIHFHKDYHPDFTDTFDETNCWEISPRSSKDHPAVFPQELCKKILRYYSFPNELVLDPFAGSGTFGEVAMEMKRIPLLCEQHPDYIQKLKEKGFVTINQK